MDIAPELGVVATREEIQELYEAFIRAAEGNGWLIYQWRNSLEEEPYRKISYVSKVTFEGDNYVVEVEFNFEKQPVARDAFGNACSAESNLPCSFSTTSHLASHTLAYAISANNVTVSDRISNDAEFRGGNFYVFAYDFNGTCVAHGLNPSFVGMTLDGVFDDMGIDQDGERIHNLFRIAAQQCQGYVLGPNLPFATVSSVAKQILVYLLLYPCSVYKIDISCLPLL